MPVYSDVATKIFVAVLWMIHPRGLYPQLHDNKRIVSCRGTSAASAGHWKRRKYNSPLIVS